MSASPNGRPPPSLAAKGGRPAYDYAPFWVAAGATDATVAIFIPAPPSDEKRLGLYCLTDSTSLTAQGARFSIGLRTSSMFSPLTNGGEVPMKAARQSGQAASKAKKSRSADLAVLVTHRLRAKCWVILAERPASPNELSRMFKEPLARVAYHVRELRDAGVIELADERQVRGSTEHFYRAVERPLLDDEGTAVRSVKERNEYARYIFQREFADANVSLEDGVFGERHDHWVVRFPMQVDEEGWQELHAAYDELTTRIMDAQAASADRLAQTDGANGAIPVSAFAAYFEMPRR